MIKEYCIIYEKFEGTTVMSAEGPIGTYGTYEIKTVTIPAINMLEAIKYATKALEIENIKECFELDSEAI